ncbi:MAG: hypothetical protein A2786_01010 [Candidatus Chisholmbacteria bacterium RIFCSPHIGHO2_01_FULL_52_32]|uniref:Uncharacterized protein n=1 Tax=Candidatus Chisholmbacteria bacterium RIFCSPHIGHO2_01_FULL_52_32 TaxID=1797591 RepID=A0A1G1VUE2_9BACT|nr:MAG: hypothetical protein A2786_01010 [Candidatus Chisholmbacteria bacterium RIFCSPHIGHO2_01_FULL_52_32]
MNKTEGGQSGKIRSLVTAVAIFLPVYGVYVWTSPATVYWQDSGIFLAGIKALGIVYPPGFPLYVGLGWVWTRVLGTILGESVPFAKLVGAFSGLWGAGAAVLVGLTAQKIIRGVRENQGKGQDRSQRNVGDGVPAILVPVVVGLTLGFSYSLWAQSINAEVYSLIGFFTAFLFWGIVSVISEYGTEKEVETIEASLKRRMLLLSLLLGLSFANHPSAVVFLPAFFWFLGRLGLLPFQYQHVGGRRAYPSLGWRDWRRFLLVFVLAAVLPYLYLPIRSAAQPEYLWTNIDSLGSFVGHISGKVYLAGRDSLKLFDAQKLTSFPRLFFQEFFVVGIIIGLVGWNRLRKQGEKYGLVLEFGAVVAGFLYLLVSVYEQGTEYNYWLIPFYVWFSILIGLGIERAVAGRKRQLWLASFLGLAVLLPQMAVNWRLLNRHDYVLAREFGENLLGKLPSGSVLFTLGDQESAIPLYLQQVEGFRKDVVLVWDNSFTFNWKRERLAAEHPELVVPRAIGKNGVLSDEEAVGAIDEFIAKNIGEHDIFLITRNVIPVSEELFLIPDGTLWKVVKEPKAVIDLDHFSYSYSDPKRYLRPERAEHSMKRKNVLGDTIALERGGYSDQARTFELQAKKNLAEWCLGAEQEGKAIRVRETGGAIEDWQGDKLATCALEAYEGMLAIDPSFYHREIFLSLSNLYARMGNEAKAMEYYNRVLLKSQQ